MASNLTNDELMALDDIIVDGLGMPIEKDATGKWMATVLANPAEKKELIYDASLFAKEKWDKLSATDFALACDIKDNEADPNNARTRYIIRSSSTNHPLFMHDDGYYYDCSGYRLPEQPPRSDKKTGERVDSVSKVAIAMISEAAKTAADKKGVQETWIVTSPNFYDYSNVAEYANDCALFDAEFGGPAQNVETSRWIGTLRPTAAQPAAAKTATTTTTSAQAAPAAAAKANNNGAYGYYYDYDDDFVGYYSDVYYDDDVIYDDDDVYYDYEF